MDILKSLLADAGNGIMIFCFVLDAILVLVAIGLFVWYYLKTAKVSTNKKPKKTRSYGTDVEKINDDTYVINTETDEEQVAEPVEQDNAVEHFINQISDFNEEADQELKETAVIVNHPVEQPVKKIVNKEEIQNFVKVDGVHKTKTGDEKQKTFNRGSNAYNNSTNFFNSIKEAAKEEPKTTTKKSTKKD